MKKIISIILAFLLLPPATSGAIEIQDDWINLSSWAYNDVSNFTNEGLLPDSFSGITDYRADITREQFAELIYSVFFGERAEWFDGHNKTDYFNDTSNPIINYLYEYNIFEEFTDEDLIRYFHPGDPITREDAARIINCAHYSPIPEYVQKKFDDDAQIQDRYKNDVYALTNAEIMKGTGNNLFSPKAHMSIEQTIVILMRAYYKMPEASDADGAGIKAESETLIKTYDNGFYETKLRETLYIKDGDVTLMSFDTDVYSNIICAENNGRRYILARNFKKRTEVYDADTKKLLFTIPHPVKKIDGGYIYTVSSVTDAWFYGLYDFNGNEILPAKYSEYEARTLSENGFQFKEEPLPELYYAIDDDNGEETGIYHYSNEKITKLSNIRSHYINLIDDRLFYSDWYRDTLSCMKTDGSDILTVTNQPEGIFKYTDNDGRAYIYFIDVEFDAENKNYYSPFSTQPGGKPYLYRAYFENGRLVKERALDIPMSACQICIYDNMIYFKEYGEGLPFIAKTSSLYRYDGKEAVCVRENDVLSFSLSRNGIMLDIVDKNDDTAHLNIEYNGIANTEYENELIPEKVSLFGEPVKDMVDTMARHLFLNNNVSDQDLRVYSNASETLLINSDGEIIAKLGNTSPICRYKDFLYYFSAGAIYRYDTKKAQKQLIAKNFDYFFIERPELSSFYCRDKLGNLYLLCCEDGTIEHIYPSHSVSENSDSAKVKSILIRQLFFNEGYLTDYCLADGSKDYTFMP